MKTPKRFSQATKKQWVRPVLVVLTRKKDATSVLAYCKMLTPGGGGQWRSPAITMGNSCSVYRWNIKPADPDCYNYCKTNHPS